MPILLVRLCWICASSLSVKTRGIRFGTVVLKKLLFWEGLVLKSWFLNHQILALDKKGSKEVEAGDGKLLSYQESILKKSLDIVKFSQAV